MKEVKMVESFSNNNKDSNFIEGAKIIENFSDNNGNGSSIFQGKIREQDFSAEQKLNELKAAIEELTRQDLLRRLECERQASSCIDEISSQAELHIGKGGDEDYFTGEKGRVLGDFWNFFESLFNLFEVDVDDPKIYQMLKKKKEKNWPLSIIKFLRDKLKELIKKIFARDLSFDQRLDKEIKELQEKLGSGELSGEEFARALERLTALQDLKLRLQMAVVGWIVTMFAEMFGVELAAAVEASTEKEDKKAEKTSLKEEAIKEVHKDVEIKVDEREKPKVPVFLFEISPGFVRPIPLSKPELDLLSNSLKDRVPFVQTHDRGKEDIENLPKQEVNKEDKKAKPKKGVCPPDPKTATNTTGKVQNRRVQRCDSDWQIRKNLETHGSTPSRPAQSSISSKEASNQSAESSIPSGSASGQSARESASNREVPEQSNQANRRAPNQSVKSSVVDYGYGFAVGVLNDAENEGSVSNAQPASGCSNVKVNNHVDSMGKAPERAPSRGY
ncbi:MULTISPECIES: hypothetical protein [Wolbachia]|uniref:hypothetical protein n=3 Tax=Wolbachieae TaxID=952 RepID=UPI0009D1CAE2|nr:hypothetical protein [Wolbachia pipientis]ONI57676.1 hypothetical protein N499_0660 [Wolbachia pipientis wVitA]